MNSLLHTWFSGPTFPQDVSGPYTLTAFQRTLENLALPKAWGYSEWQSGPILFIEWMVPRTLIESAALYIKKRKHKMEECCNYDLAGFPSTLNKFGLVRTS